MTDKEQTQGIDFVINMFVMLAGIKLQMSEGI